MVDDGPWLSCKFTNEPEGSGELKIQHLYYSKFKLGFTKKDAARIAHSVDPEQTTVSIPFATFLSKY